jgi:hypothetical protein
MKTWFVFKPVVAVYFQLRLTNRPWLTGIRRESERKDWVFYQKVKLYKIFIFVSKLFGMGRTFLRLLLSAENVSTFETTGLRLAIGHLSIWGLISSRGQRLGQRPRRMGRQSRRMGSERRRHMGKQRRRMGTRRRPKRLDRPWLLALVLGLARRWPKRRWRTMQAVNGVINFSIK